MCRQSRHAPSRPIRNSSRKHQLAVASLLSASALVGLTLDAHHAFAATVSWVRVGDGNWNDPTAWSPAPPVAGDTVVLPDVGVAYTVTSAVASVNLAGLTLTPQARLNITSGGIL